MRSHRVGRLVLAACLVCWLPALARGADRPPARSDRAVEAVQIPNPAGPGGASRSGEASTSSVVPAYRPVLAEEERSVFWDGVRMALSLAVVLGVLAVGVKVLRRWPGLAGGAAAAGSLHVVGRLALGAKEAVCLIRVGDELLVVGVTPAGITLLHRLEEASAARVQSAGAQAPGSALAPREGTSRHRLRELTDRLREVQAAWRVDAADSRPER